MARGITQRGRDIRACLIHKIPLTGRQVTKIVAEKFGISRQAVNRHMKALIEEGLVKAKGSTRNREYELAILEELGFEETLEGLEEHIVWEEKVKPFLAGLPQNAIDNWEYAFTEILNNAIDHSESESVGINLRKTAAGVKIGIMDSGIGIFRKISTELELPDERMALLELAKGKLTTDPSKHSGEGIFFTSRVMDIFYIFSWGLNFSHRIDSEYDLLMEADDENADGTWVSMYMDSDTTTNLKEIYDEFASEENDFAFDKTIIPVRMARLGNENLVSRSQAKRLLARIERFGNVVLDFEGVESVGQAFADEVFRVFVSEHPDVRLAAIKANKAVMKMISRAQAVS